MDIASFFSTLSFLSALIVVSSHVQIVVSGKAVHFFSSYLCAGHVYSFFFISGFFISRHFKGKEWYYHEVSKRIRSLLIPYTFWCAAYGILKFAESRQLTMSVTTLFGLGFGIPPYNIPLWYCKCLFTFVLLSPIVAWLSMGKKTWVLLLLGIWSVFWLVGWSKGWPIMENIHYGASIRGFMLFAMGSYCQLNFGSRYLLGVTIGHAVMAGLLWIAFAACAGGGIHQTE